MDLRQLVGEQEILMVADSKLVSYTSISALLKSKVPFIAPAPGRPDQRRVLCQPRS
ncbi:hypothetical protein [Streptomyces sp. NPDC001275]